MAGRVVLECGVMSSAMWTVGVWCDDGEGDERVEARESSVVVPRVFFRSDASRGLLKGVVVMRINQSIDHRSVTSELLAGLWYSTTTIIFILYFDKIVHIFILQI